MKDGVDAAVDAYQYTSEKVSDAYEFVTDTAGEIYESTADTISELIHGEVPPEDPIVQAEQFAADEACSAECLTDTDCTPPEQEKPFTERFEEITGMTLDDAIKLYEGQTGEELSPATVEALFTDPVKSGEILMADETLHTNFRNILNTNIPATAELAKDAGFRKLSFMQSIFHNPFSNTKWVGPDGYLEAVYDGNGDLVTSNSVKGTFNFFGPDDAAGHTEADIWPYFKWGN